MLKPLDLEFNSEYDDALLSKTLHVAFVNLRKNSFICEIAMLEKYIDLDLREGNPVRLGDKGVFVIQSLRKQKRFATASVVSIDEYRSQNFSRDQHLLEEFNDNHELPPQGQQ